MPFDQEAKRLMTDCVTAVLKTLEELAIGQTAESAGIKERFE